jgi:hypothetical protein
VGLRLNRDPLGWILPRVGDAISVVILTQEDGSSWHRGTELAMSDYSEQGPIPVEDAAVDDPPTVDEVLEQQRIKHPEQVPTSTMQPATTREESATADAGGEIVGHDSEGGLDIEGPNSA